MPDAASRDRGGGSLAAGVRRDNSRRPRSTPFMIEQPASMLKGIKMRAASPLAPIVASSTLPVEPYENRLPASTDSRRTRRFRIPRIGQDDAR